MRLIPIFLLFFYENNLFAQGAYNSNPYANGGSPIGSQPHQGNPGLDLSYGGSGDNWQVTNQRQANQKANQRVKDWEKQIEKAAANGNAYSPFSNTNTVFKQVSAANGGDASKTAKDLIKMVKDPKALAGVSMSLLKSSGQRYGQFARDGNKSSQLQKLRYKAKWNS